ncbi:hypothetical protein [Alteromonas sp. C1M14]|uniref:hypothetical protein n=1 Tax=Alteromonas sp. C1M14 TaxID=2841567 RepID=UPI001C09E277|nr:hypothetical protein [Alteromonas sp. C1M14]MBU2978552.1 hypothetical protein [Alteromonas sp. C1M14]
MKVLQFIVVTCAALMVCLPSEAKEVAKAYEMAVFNGEQAQSGGLPLAYPGDRYRYTFVLDDEYSQDSQMYIKNAIVGVHIIDEDWHAEQGDGEPEWGTILIGDTARTWIKPAHLTSYDYHQGDTPVITQGIEIQSEYEVSNYAGGVPPYIFAVTEEVEQNRYLTVEVINTNAKGETTMTPPYGDFTLLRIGLRVVWASRE